MQLVQEWLSAGSIVKLKIRVKGFPTTLRRVLERAKRDNYQFRDVPSCGAKGFRREFHINSFPENVHAAILLKITPDLLKENSKNKNLVPIPSSQNLPVSSSTSIEKIMNLPIPADNKDPWYSLSESCRDAGYKNLGMVNGFRDLRARKNKSKSKALREYAKKQGSSDKTLYRLMKKADEALAEAKKTGEEDTTFAQIKVLTPKYGGTKNTIRSFTPDAIKLAGSLYLNQMHLNIKDIYREVVNTAGVHGWRVGSYDSLISILGRLDKSTCILGRKGNKAFEANCQTKILRDYSEIPPNFMWCGDHHIFDVFVKVPDGKGSWKPMRPWLTAWMDMASRSFVGWVISFNPDSRCIAMALAHGISEKNDKNFPQHGLPDSVYIDNGKDYRSKYLNGEIIEIGKIDYPAIIEKYAALGISPFYIDMKYDPQQDAWVKKRGQKEIIVKGIRVGGVYGRFGINSHYAIAYHPWSKPIERAFRNVAQSFSRSLPGWCGSGHEQRPEKLTFELKKGNLLTVDEFCDAWYNWVTNVYHKNPHRGHGMNGMSPDQVFTSRLPKPQKVEPKLLDFALMKKERVKINNWGFKLNGREFELDLLSNLHGGHLTNNLIGTWARVLFDYNYRTIRVYKDAEYICDAKPLNRASFITPDDPVMIDKLELQSYQKKASKNIIKAFHTQARAIEGSTDEGLLRLTHGDADSTIPKNKGDNVIPINNDERYRMILRKLAKGKALSVDDDEFKSEFEQTEEYHSYKELYGGVFEQFKYEHEQKRRVG